MHYYEVIVGNVGTVYSGTDRDACERIYAHYVHASKTEAGRAAGEIVTALQDGEIYEEYTP